MRINGADVQQRSGWLELTSGTPLRCRCGSLDLVCVEPGDAPVLAPGGIVIDAGRLTTGRCLACWNAGGVQQEMRL